MTDTNYRELVSLYNTHKSNGLEILAFPCNQFGAQEPGSDAEIKAFADKYGVTFPMFSKVDVNGSNAHPLFKWARDCAGSFPSDDIKWNFGKFLIDKDGRINKRFAPTDSPLSIESDIKKLL